MLLLDQRRRPAAGQVELESTAPHRASRDDRRQVMLGTKL
jgi:hypothetical protein